MNLEFLFRWQEIFQPKKKSATFQIQFFANSFYIHYNIGTSIMNFEVKTLTFSERVQDKLDKLVQRYSYDTSELMF